MKIINHPTAVYASLLIFALWLAMAAAPAAKADVYVYDYTGSDFVACGPTSSSCPSNYTSDYIIASLSFNQPLGDGITVTDDFSSLSAWSISDQLGYFSFSSNDPLAASELEAIQITTNESGDIIGYYMEVSSADRPEPGYETAFIQPALIPTGGADYMDLSHGVYGEWATSSAQSGVWSASVVETPEPSYTALTTLFGAVLLIAVRRKHRGYTEGFQLHRSEASNSPPGGVATMRVVSSAPFVSFRNRKIEAVHNLLSARRAHSQCERRVGRVVAANVGAKLKYYSLVVGLRWESLNSQMGNGNRRESGQLLGHLFVERKQQHFFVGSWRESNHVFSVPPLKFILASPLRVYNRSRTFPEHRAACPRL